MKWSRELRIARRSLRTAVKAASAMAATQGKLPALLRPAPQATPHPLPGCKRPVEITGFGSNPGRLSMLAYLPAKLLPGAPLIVLLHGCGQDAVGFAESAGWIALADRLGFPLVLPEQSDANNRGRCFNWFRPIHTRRDLGESLSIRQMAATAVERFGADPARVFVAGLSAGGAMAAVLLAAYPDVFAAGAVVAGLPVGAASSACEALRRMAEAGPAGSPAVWAEQVRRAGPNGYRGPWPRLSIWHGESDRVVDPANARLLAAQWCGLLSLDAAPTETTRCLDLQCDRWIAGGRPAVELWTGAKLAHDWPPGAAQRILDFWGIGTG